MVIDVKSFEAGTIFNPLIVPRLMREPVLEEVEIRYPSRLEAMALDPSKIADDNNLVYPAGQIDFCVGIYKHIRARVLDHTDAIQISDETPRKALIKHAAMITRAALGIEYGFAIDVVDDANLRHCGLGSSSSLIAGTAAAINELFGCPISPTDMVRYCAQNHGEEMDRSDNRLVPVQCIGGSAACGHFEGGLIVLAGQATPIYRKNLPDTLKVVIGVPEEFEHPDSEQLMQAEIENIDGFRNSGNRYGPTIAYRMIHEVLPGLERGYLKPCKDLIFDYRWDMGSIANCSFVYPKMLDIAESLRDLRNDESVSIISLSSVGPGFFAITHEVSRVEERFRQQGMRTITAEIHNAPYVKSKGVE